MGVYISLSSEVGGRALYIGAWALKGTNTVFLSLQKLSSKLERAQCHLSFFTLSLK